MAIPRQRIHLPAGAITQALRCRAAGALWRGDAIDEFQRAFAADIKAANAVVTPSGRAGLRSILDALDLEPGSEIICPAYGYPVVPHLVRSMGYQLKLVDCEAQSLGLDPEKLADAVTPRTSAVIAMHLFGVPCRIADIVEACPGVAVIEDCAHCFGATVGGRHVGTIGTVGYFSFETSKMINTLGGGMITTQDADLAARITEKLRSDDDRTLSWLVRRLAKTSFEAAVTSAPGFNLGVYPALRFADMRADPERFASGYQPDHFTMSGRTGRYTNYQAKLGLQGLKAARRTLPRRVELAQRLISRLADRLDFQTPAADAVANYMLVTALAPDMTSLASRLLRRGVDSKHHYMRSCAPLLEIKGDFPVAERADDEVIHLPCFPGMSDAHVDRIAAAVEASLGDAAPVAPLAAVGD